MVWVLGFKVEELGISGAGVAEHTCDNLPYRPNFEKPVVYKDFVRSPASSRV